MLDLDQRPTDSIPAATTDVTFDGERLKLVYRVVYKVMNGRRAVLGMEADDLVQVILLLILKSESCGPKKIGHLGLVRTIARNYVRRQEQRAMQDPRVVPLPETLAARRRPDPLLVREFLDEASSFLNDTHLELLTLCLKKGYQLDRRSDRRAAAGDLGVTLDHLRHILDKLRERHGEFWRQYLALF